MDKSKSFIQHLIKPFKFNSSKGNIAKPSSYFLHMFLICYVPDHEMIYVLLLLWSIRQKKWRRFGEDCSTGAEAISIWDLTCCHQRISPNSQARPRWIWTRIQGKIMIHVWFELPGKVWSLFGLWESLRAKSDLLFLQVCLASCSFFPFLFVTGNMNIWSLIYWKLL